MMKKVLIIAYPFPPNPAIGSQRPYRLAKYFPEFGWEPIVLTVKRAGEKPHGIKIIETDYTDILNNIKAKIGYKSQEDASHQASDKVSTYSKKINWKTSLNKLFKEVVLFPDHGRGWYKFALKAASEFIEKEKVDIIISTSSPVTSHLIARQLKLKYNIPWIADLRDLWSQNPYYNKFALIAYFEKQLELKTLHDADAIVTVTHPWIKTLGILHKNNIYCVTNGYDDSEFPDKHANLSKKFTLTYAGGLYYGKRDPALLFESLSELIKENKVVREFIEIRFYGPKETWLSEKVKHYNLEDIVKLYDVVPREVVLKKLGESQILLLLIWNNEKESGFCPGKIYEYFGSRRPILAIGWPKGVVKDLLDATNTGKVASTVETVKDIFLEYYQEYLHSGEVRFKSNQNIENYIYKNISNQYSEILNKYAIQ